MYRGNKIEIKRDFDFNIPTINGGSKLAALYGLGYVTAEDRLFQMHIKRMVGKGRLSEMVGEKGVNLDIMFRELGVGVISKEGSENMRI
jgi:penicillin amidase